MLMRDLAPTQRGSVQRHRAARLDHTVAFDFIVVTHQMVEIQSPAGWGWQKHRRGNHIERDLPTSTYLRVRLPYPEPL